MADQIKAERLRALQLTNLRAAEQRLAEQGRYTRTSEVRRGYREVADHMVGVIDGAIIDMAQSISGKFGLSSRDVLLLLRAEWTNVRKTASAAARRRCDELPQFMEDHVPDATDEPLGEA